MGGIMLHWLLFLCSFVWIQKSAEGFENYRFTSIIKFAKHSTETVFNL